MFKSAMIFQIFVTAIALLTLQACDSTQDSRTGLSALGIHSFYVEPGEISKVSIVRDVGGERKEWIARPLAAECLGLHIQLGLPTNVMRMAIVDSTSSLISSYKTDIIGEHGYSFTGSPIDKAGEYILMRTMDSEQSKQNKIILIAQ